MNQSKAAILTSIRRNRPTAADLPKLHHEWTTYADRQRQFVEVLQSVGGQALVASSPSDLGEQLRRLPFFSNAQHIVSLVPGIVPSGVDMSLVSSPHALADIDVAILPGEFAVAENAAVWVTAREVSLRAIYFLCQHLVLVVPAGRIVDHMHAAYQGLVPLVFEKPMFGVYISGPSKTADIEQSLVIGAQGPRSLTVALLAE